jgi:hypothetical protein
MKRKLFIALLMSASLALFSVFACSSSDDDDNGVQPISQTDLQAQVQQDMDLILTSVLQGFENWDGFEPPSSDDAFGKATVTAEPKDTSEGYQNGWHYFIMSGSDTESDEYGTYSYTVSLADSVQFKENGTPVQVPTSSTDFLQFIMHMTLTMDISFQYDTTSIDLDLSFDKYDINNTYQELPNGDIEVDGSFEYDYSLTGSGSEGIVTGDIVYDLTISNLVIDDNSGCPQSGTITADATMNVSGPDGGGQGSYSMTITFTNSSTITVHAESGGNTYDWTDTYVCEGVSGSPNSFLSDIVFSLIR